ncbi:MAG: gluconeogenesis factor YvcK family protein [Chloroflexota bacterium]|nr:gluconeogenesis factor YvcK family protein [Chloroflexota bacterium]
MKWLYPGMGVKRWLALLLVGITCLSLGAAYVLVNIYREQPLPSIFYYITLQFIPRLGRAALFGGLGLAAVTVAVLRLSKSLLAPFLRPGQDLAEAIYRHHQRSHGPKVVAIGGGHGLSILLRGLKEHTANITAIVTVADDGGSSGRLRRQLGVLPPGDLRNCIAALADDEALTTQLFQYRFTKGFDLNGHSFGNLFIAAMAEVAGSFERAILESSRVLAVQGRILPSTLQNVTLCAELHQDGGSVEGESQIPKSRLPIERVFLKPQRVRAYPEVLRAILDADLIVAGPGSLYTSILPNLLVPEIIKAIRSSRALKVYICNVATQLGETEGYSVSHHVEALQRHVGRDIFPFVLANDDFEVELPTHLGIELVPLPGKPSGSYQLITAGVIDAEKPWRHDPSKLARCLMDFYHSTKFEGVKR